MSENNYSALMIKSALNQSVDIDSYILPGIYPVSSGNASSPHPDSGVLVVYSGTVLQRSFISGSVIIASSSYDQENNVWGEWNFAASRNDLLSSEKGFGASLVRLESGKTLQQEINSLEHLERS
ncbi:TPA: hypothetical protein RVE23_004916, partial [Escherichia coli]|nr:hypothetical protein [Escherichia coli]